MLSMPPNDPGRNCPLDHPSLDRPHRVYVALTNHCNRACPWCSTCSSPQGNTWLSREDYEAGLPRNGFFQVQLEGGEPTTHPQFWDFVRIARQHPRCTHLVLCTNGVVLPRTPAKLHSWIERLGTPLTLKLSINHYLIEHDPGLLALALDLRDRCRELGGERLLVLNVRLRKAMPTTTKKSTVWSSRPDFCRTPTSFICSAMALRPRRATGNCRRRCPISLPWSIPMDKFTARTCWPGRKGCGCCSEFQSRLAAAKKCGLRPGRQQHCPQNRDV